MKILRFRGAKLNGYLDLDVAFYPDLTFVTGINGSGKTTVLIATVSLIMPRLDFLSFQDYKKISIDIDIDGRKVTLSSERTRNGAVLRASHVSEEGLEIQRIEWDDSLPPHRNREMEDAFFREQIAKTSDHPVMKFIQGLPTPMFLGLDRRILPIDEDAHKYASRSAAYYRPKRRNIFSQSLSQSLNEAVSFASEAYRSAQRVKGQLDDTFRKDLVLDLIDFTPSDLSGHLERPSSKDWNRIEDAKKNLQRLPDLLNVSEEIVSQKITPLFAMLEETKGILKRKRKSSDDRPNEEEVVALFRWSFNKSHLAKISSISDRISKYNQNVEKEFMTTSTFVRSVNSFISDSGKTIKFDRLGELVFSTSGGTGERDLRSLSSGEIQIIVILAHLHFNPDVRKASIFIIDEPELSLHIEWQEKFVDALLASTSKTQFVMATHSPSIILEKVALCIDLSPKP